MYIGTAACPTLSCSTKDLDIPELRAHSVLAWAGNRMGAVLDRAGMFLTEAEAIAFVATLFRISITLSTLSVEGVANP